MTTVTAREKVFYLSAGKNLLLTRALTNLPLITHGIPSGGAVICCCKP